MRILKQIKDEEARDNCNHYQGSTGYSAHALVNDISINTQGETLEELKGMIIEAVNLSFDDKGFLYTENELKFLYDLESFFKFYKVINAKALSKRIGMNQSLLSQYNNGIKNLLHYRPKGFWKGSNKSERNCPRSDF